MRLGVSSLFAENLPLFEHLPLLPKNSILDLEIYCYDYPSSLDQAYWEELAGQVDKNGIQVYSFHTPFFNDISSLDKAVRQQALRDIEDSLKAANLLQAKFAIVHPGYFCPPEDKADRVRLSQESLDKIYGFCLKSGIRMAVENMPPRFVGNGVEGLSEVIKGLPAEAGICLDAGHSFMGQTPPQDFVRHFGQRLFTLHLHDNDGKDDQHLLPGEGKINWASLMKELQENQFKGVYMMEIGNYKEPKEILSQAKKIGDGLFAS